MRIDRQTAEIFYSAVFVYREEVQPKFIVMLTIKVQGAGNLRRPARFVGTVKVRWLRSPPYIAGSDFYVIDVPAIEAVTAIHAEVIAQADGIAPLDPQHG
jgi:hypothetical protein